MHNLKKCRSFLRLRCEHVPAAKKGLSKPNLYPNPKPESGDVSSIRRQAQENSLKEALRTAENLDNTDNEMFLYTSLCPPEQLPAKQLESSIKYMGLNVLCVVALSVLLLLIAHGLGISKLLIRKGSKTEKEGKLMQSFKDLLVRVSQEVRLFLYTFTWPY
jgi:hypothetical protein